MPNQLDGRSRARGGVFLPLKTDKPIRHDKVPFPLFMKHYRIYRIFYSVELYQYL